jgi:hypothetical protein
MDEIIQLKVLIKDSKPAIWRRLLVKQDTTLFELHHILQIAFDWQNYHAFEFEHEGYVYRMPEYADLMDEDNILDVGSNNLDALIVEAGECLKYVYDFGDNWEHRIEIEKFLQAGAGQYPCCIEGELSCPPEDCGGISAYYSLLEVLKDPKHADYRETKRWIGKNFSPTEFDIQKVNKQLSNLNGYIVEWVELQ